MSSPTLKDGDCVEAIQGPTPEVGDIVVAHHPMKNMTVIIRIKRIQSDGIFLEGDNPGPIGSEDSHNFGPVSTSLIIAIICDRFPLELNIDGEACLSWQRISQAY